VFDPAAHALFGELGASDLGFRLLLLAHLLCVIVGFGSTFVWPVLGAEAGRRPGPGGLALSETALRASRFLTVYPIYGAGAFGFALAIAAGRMDEMWTQAALAIFLVAVLFSALVHIPNLEKMDALAHELAGQPPGGGGGGPPPQVMAIQSRANAAARNGGILHVAFVVLLVLMIWQPS
jgi:hypothetical protein